jgi:hypothetical protein
MVAFFPTRCITAFENLAGWLTTLTRCINHSVQSIMTGPKYAPRSQQPMRVKIRSTKRTLIMAVMRPFVRGALLAYHSKSIEHKRNITAAIMKLNG